MSGGARYDAFYIRDTLEIFLRSRSTYKTSQDYIVLPCDGTSSYFLQNMVLQEVVFKKRQAVFKKEDPNNKRNYRPISLLPIISKIFERVLFEQIDKFSEKILSPKLCAFRKGHSTQHAILILLKNWQKTLDKSDVIRTVLMDLSKAYDCLPHDLLIAELAAYGFEDSATCLLSDYLSERCQRF